MGAPAARQRPTTSTEERLVVDLIALMEGGGCPWRRPWREEGGHHVNLLSGRAYRGANPVLLSLGMGLRGSELPYWCGWGEAQRLGVSPRRGSRGVTILRPVRPRAPEASLEAAKDPGAAGEAKATPGELEAEAAGHPAPARSAAPGFSKPMVVFNAADLVGDREGSKALAERIGRCRATARSSAPERDERLQRAESVLAAWPVERCSGGEQACYNPWLDRIQLPEAHRFCSEAARLATWAHEAIHSTGHPSRLGRNLSAPFGSAPYAREELVAELGAVLLGERLAIGSETANHAAYLKHWCELLRQEPRLLLQVLGEARRAADLIAPEAEHAAGKTGHIGEAGETWGNGRPI